MRSENTIAIKSNRYVLILALILTVEFIALAFNPHERSAWLLENMLFVLFFTALVFSHRKFPFSKVSYTLIFIFLFLHEIGAHYTYSLVPYDDWAEWGFSLNISEWLGWQRNHFDRFLHFLYGLLLTYPLREFYFRVADAKGFWAYFIPLILVMATSMIYELIEWGAAAIFGGELGMAYLGTQGDIWDGHKDMALASLGALIAMLITLAINLAIQNDFHREWSESLRIKHPEPLGEEELKRLLSDKRE
ncbi:DUF2238 domain-containing protein [Aurantivibrio infirmus]